MSEMDYKTIQSLARFQSSGWRLDAEDEIKSLRDLLREALKALEFGNIPSSLIERIKVELGQRTVTESTE